MDVPETRYATTEDGVHIAYQIVGDGPGDLLFVPYDYSNIEVNWELPQYASFARGLATHARVLLMDRRGIGASDRGIGASTPTIEARMDDIRAVMDAAGSERAALFGVESGATLCFPFAATHPERVTAVIVFGATVAGTVAEDYPWGWTHAEWEPWLERIDQAWGSDAFVRDLADWITPSLASDPGYRKTIGRLLRLAASPGDAIAHDRINRDTDVRHVLPTIQTPALVIHRTDDRVEDIGQGRYIAEHIPGATFLELPGDSHVWPLDEVIPHIASFLRSLREQEAEFDRVLATVLFTDIVGSTERAAQLGDHAWRELLERHHSTVRAMLGRYRGTEVDTAGDGFFATFDGPVRAIRCAQAIVEALGQLGIEIRAGCHTGEVATIDGKAGGMGVVIGARVGAIAGTSEVLVSQTIKDLSAGSGITFKDAGEHELKGVPDRWRLYRVVA
ncbi:MAG: adenylate/guanylate cyclase domain-containing protein [Actinomycetota bacterium]